MNRWTASLLGALGALLVCIASAQTDATKPTPREFPKNAKRGELVILTAPEIALNNQADRLSPAARVRDINNNLVLSGTLVNQTLVVNYVRDNTGLVHNVWVLNSEEIKQKMPGPPDSMLNNIRSMFDTPAVRDDGNTPYNQLPKYQQ